MGGGGGGGARLVRFLRHLVLGVAGVVAAHQQRELSPRARHREDQPQRHRAARATSAARVTRRHAALQLPRLAVRARLRVLVCAPPSQRQLDAVLGTGSGGNGRACACQLEPDRRLRRIRARRGCEARCARTQRRPPPR